MPCCVSSNLQALSWLQACCCINRLAALCCIVARVVVRVLQDGAMVDLQGLLLSQLLLIGRMWG